MGFFIKQFFAILMTMSRGKQNKSKRMFIYYDMRPEHEKPQLHDYVCSWPPHITLAVTDTHSTNELLEKIDETTSHITPFQIERGELGLVGGKKLRPAYLIEDPTHELQGLHMAIVNAIGRSATSQLVHAHNTANEYLPHITVGRLYTEPYRIPKSITINNFIVTENFRQQELHHRGIVRHIGRLAT